jgi:hypothetical protein
MARGWKLNGEAVGIGVAFMVAVGAFITGATYFLSPGETQNATETDKTEVAERNSARKQDSNDVSINRDGVDYALWEGLVMEEPDNNELSSSFKTQYDQQIYNYDLGVVLHVSRGDGMISTPMKDLRAEHLDRVRGIGCEIVGEFEKREADGKGGLPDDVASFKARHCKPAGP